MTHSGRDEERDERIEMEIIVDTYDADEQAMGWHAYLDEHRDQITAISRAPITSSTSGSGQKKESVIWLAK